MLMKYFFRFFSILCVSILLLSFGIATAQDLTIGNYTLISKQRVSRIEYKYTYQADIINTGSDVQNVTATLTSNSPNTCIIDGSLSFGNVNSESTVTSSGTFTIKQNRRYLLDWTELVWDIQYDLILGPSGGIFEGKSGVAVTVPPGATNQSVPICIEPVQGDELDINIPPGYTFLGAANLDIGDVVLNTNADITIQSPPEIPEDAEIYVAKVVEYAGTKMFMMVDIAIIQEGSIVSQMMADAPFPFLPYFTGIVDSGIYCFFWGQNVGWVGGKITHASNGVGLPAWAGNFVVVAFDDQTGEHGEKQGYMPSNGATVNVNVQIGESAGPIQDALINGDFETGDLTGWELGGAGGVVTSFGPILPYEGSYMAMISSGSGAIGDASSALEQSFTVPVGATTLTIHYNFVSEEYPEFVGSQYNDVFNATLHTPDGAREIVFEEVNSANFQPVEGIPCGSGDCTWGQTGWITASIDVSQWAGTDDTLTLTVHDVGDTIYDTVVLLDNIEFPSPICNAPDQPENFFNIENPTCEDRWDMLIFIKELYNGQMKAAQDIIYADIVGVVSDTHFRDAGISVATSIASLYDLTSIPEMDMYALWGLGGNKSLEFAGELLGNEVANIWMSALGAALQNISTGDPSAVISWSVSQLLQAWNNSIGAFSVSELTERFIEIEIAKTFLFEYYSWGGSYAFLALSYGKPYDVGIDEIIHAIGDQLGYSDPLLLWFEDYKTEKVRDIILKCIDLVNEKSVGFLE